MADARIELQRIARHVGLVTRLVRRGSPELKDLAVDGLGIAAGLVVLAVAGDWARRTAARLLSLVVRG